MTTTTRTRTITLTGRAPVTIREDRWPRIARASGDSYRGNDGGRHHEARLGGELDLYTLCVRRHADGRAIVYGVLDAATAWTGTQAHSGGVLLDAGADIAAAIRRVGEECGLPDSIIRDCIADLPAVSLDPECPIHGE